MKINLDMIALNKNKKDVENEQHPGTKLSSLPKTAAYSVSESFKLYFGGKPMKYYEDQLLSNLEFYNKPAKDRRSEIIDTSIDKDGNFIHEFYVENTLPPTKGGEPIEIVLIHGYGAALGFFYRNFEGLTSIPGTKLHAIDLLGFGLSSRPTFPNINGDTIEGVKKAEAFFNDSLEKWRIARGIEGKYVLMAHSLGGYLIGPYYLKYGKGHISKMVMISPVGVERSDASLINLDGTIQQKERKSLDEDYKIAKEQGVNLSREISRVSYADDEEAEEQPSIIDSLKHIDTNRDEWDKLSVASDAQENEIQNLMKQFRGRVQPGKFFASLWKKNFSPLQIVRMMGPFAPKLTAGWTWNRFREIKNEDEIRQINNYTSKIFLAKGSGEYALTRILAPGALAKLPLMDRLPGNLEIDTLWLYGQYDWMSKKDGYKICNEINHYNLNKPQGHARFRVISNAGHHVYVDNPGDFEYQVVKFLKGE